MGVLEVLQDLFGISKVVVHLTRDAGESLRAQQLLKEAGIKVNKEVEGMASTSLQVDTGHVSPIIKLKVKPKDAARAKEVLSHLPDE